MRRAQRKARRSIWPLSPLEWTCVIAGALLVFTIASVAVWKMPAGRTGYTSVDDLLDEALNLTKPVRAEPKRFAPRTSMPARREEFVSGAPNPALFNAQSDLVRLDDARVWWESDNDKRDTEDDHQVHRSMEAPLRRLIELVTASGGRLKIQDIYRDEGIHSPKSLHREGRAVDLTCDELGLEKLAKLAWAAGFDWVYYEVPRRNGAHVHASVMADRAYAKR